MSLQRVKKEHKRRAAMKEEREDSETVRPDMSQAGNLKAYVYIDFNHWWVGGRKQLIAGYDKSETKLTIRKLGRLLSAIFKKAFSNF